MFATLRVFLDFNLPNATTWFYFSFLLAIALFFKFGRLLSVRNSDVVMLFLLVPGLLVLQRAHAGAGGPDERNAVQAATLIGQCYVSAGSLATVAGTSVVALQTPAFEAGRWLWLGYLWLICGSAYFFCRCLFDLALVQRPALSANLTFGGLAWLAGALLICLMAVAFRPYERLLSPLAAPPVAASPAADPIQGTADFLLLQMFDPPGWVFRLVAVLCHIAILLGLVIVGWQHFGDASSGMAAATFYLVLPYIGLYVGQASQAWPAALLVWTIAAYRYPTLAGVLLGLAAGTALFPVVLLPAWISFYAGRGTGRFLLGWAAIVGLCVLNGAFILGDVELPGALQESLLAWLPWRVPPLPVEGFWTGVHAAYRLPVFIGYFAFILATTVWPSPKNLAQVLALSTAALVGLQLWYADQGGIYVLWYAPLLLLLAFRPNLQDHRPPPISPDTDWLARMRSVLVRAVRRLARVPEPAQIHRS
jgi:hypothetical protein